MDNAYLITEHMKFEYEDLEQDSSDFFSHNMEEGDDVHIYFAELEEYQRKIKVRGFELPPEDCQTNTYLDCHTLGELLHNQLRF